MKRNISLWLGLLAFALMPAMAQQSGGKIHGHITSPTGSAYTSGTVVLVTEQGAATKFSYPVNGAGNYDGDVDPGTYNALFRLPDTPPGKMVDELRSVKIEAGKDTAADFDMTRKEFMDTLPPETKKAIEEAKQKNAEANAVIKNLNADIQAVLQDFKDANAARAAAVQQLGASASKSDVEAKENDIRKEKFGEAEALMQKDTQVMPNASALWVQLGQAQLGLRKYDEAEASYKKTLEVEGASKKPHPQTQAAANGGLGEIYARTGKIAEAQAAYDEAAKFDPTLASMYLTNEAVIFSQVGNSDAQVAAADKAITADPHKPLPYYLKGQGLIQKATVDSATGKMILPPGCAEAYQKYIELAPNGPFVADAKGILAQASQKVDTSFKAPAKKK